MEISQSALASLVDVAYHRFNENAETLAFFYIDSHGCVSFTVSGKDPLPEKPGVFCKFAPLRTPDHRYHRFYSAIKLAVDSL